MEETGDQGNLFVADDGSEALGAGPGDGLGQREKGVVLALAEILGAKQLRQANDPGAGAGSLADHVRGVVEVLRGGGRAGHLDESDAGAWR